MRILMVTRDFPPAVGGIQTYSLEMARRLAQRAERFAVVAPRGSGSSRIDAELDFPVIRVPGPHDLFPISSAPFQRVAAAQMGADAILYTHWGAAVCSEWVRGDARPFVAAHGRELLLRPWNGLAPAQASYDRTRLAVLARMTGVFAVSRFTARLVSDLGVAPERIHVVPNGTDPERFAPRDGTTLRARLGLEGRPVVLSVGRLVRRKGFDVLLHAFGRVRLRHPRAVLLIVGQGPERRRLELDARRAGVAHAVRFLGAVSDRELPRYYAVADAFVAPTRSEPPDVEGFGLVFLEASASGVPVVGPDRGGPCDAILPGTTGLCVDPTSSEQVAIALSELLDRPRYARALGAAGREFVVAHGTWDCAADRLFAALRASVRDAPRPGAGERDTSGRGAGGRNARGSDDAARGWEAA